MDEKDSDKNKKKREKATLGKVKRSVEEDDSADVLESFRIKQKAKKKKRVKEVSDSDEPRKIKVKDYTL
jgi:hypothetical protein